MGASTKRLAKFIEDNFVMTAWGDYEGVRDNAELHTLYSLKGLLDDAIRETKIAERDKMENQNET